MRFGASLFPFFGSVVKLGKATISVVTSVCMSVRPSAQNNSGSTGRIFMKFGLTAIRKYVEKIEVL